MSARGVFVGLLVTYSLGLAIFVVYLAVHGG